jgi:hypothetical protein
VAYKEELQNYKQHQARQLREETQRQKALRAAMMERAVAENIQRKHAIRARQQLFALRQERQREYDRAKVGEMRMGRLLKERRKQLEAAEAIRLMKVQEQELLAELESIEVRKEMTIQNLKLEDA